MSGNCPYYTLPGGGKGGRAIVIGDDHCRAEKHPMCGSHDICPGSGSKKLAAEADERPGWPDVDLDEGAASEAEASPADLLLSEPEPEAPGESLAEAIRRLRTEQGFTMKNLGRAAGLAPPLISRWESGICKPALPSLKKLDQALGSDLADRFGGQAGAEKPARNPSSKKPAAAAPVSAEAHPAPAVGGRDDFIREILRQAARAREDFNAVIHAALEAVKRPE